MAARIQIVNLAGLNEGMQFFLSIFKADADITGSPRSPKEIEVGAKTLALIEGCDSSIKAISAFKRDRRIGLAGEWFGGGVQKILLRFAQFEIRVMRHG